MSRRRNGTVGGHETYIQTRLRPGRQAARAAWSRPLEAIDLANTHPEPIPLLVSDVVLPEMNGRDLAARLQKDRPELKCLYMSGYTANVIAHHGVFDKDIQFIHKPFSKKDFGGKIARILADSTSRQQRPSRPE